MDYATKNNNGIFNNKVFLYLDYPADLKLEDEHECGKNKSSSILSAS